MENFIYTKKNAISSELCNAFIKNYKEDTDLKKPGQVGHGIINNSKKSTDISFNPSYQNHPQWGPLLKELLPIVKSHLDAYFQQYMVIEVQEHPNLPVITHTWMDELIPLTDFNLQHYKPGEGFFNWHSERSNGDLKAGSDRVLAWMFYLNNVNMGGGTEFHHFNHIEEPEQGKIVIFSSEWMHVHRGVMAPFEDKYILTGWVGFAPHKKQQW